MRFSTRNTYYLRISASTILPLYLYLDERHIEWMSERVLQHVLADLRPLIIPKLNAEADAQLGPGGSANAKRGSLDVHRGDTYQFGYFLRGTEPHAVLVKSRTFTAAPNAPPRASALPPPAAAAADQRPGRGRKRTGSSRTSAGQKRKSKPRQKGKGKAKVIDEEEAVSSASDHDEGPAEDAPLAELPPRRSKRAKKVVAGGYRDDEDEELVDHDTVAAVPDMTSPRNDNDESMVTEQVHQGESLIPKQEETEPVLDHLPRSNEKTHEESRDDVEAGPSVMDVELVDDEEEPKPKPVLHLRYHGFNIHGRCLCVIVEPYPPLRSATRAPSLAPTGLIAPRAPSIAPPDFIPSGDVGRRERTPLFLPDFDREPTPAPFAMRTLPPVPLFSEAAEGSDDEDGGMVLFSQILRSVGDHPPGIAEDDDEIDGAVFFGDADETREL